MAAPGAVAERGAHRLLATTRAEGGQPQGRDAGAECGRLPGFGVRMLPEPSHPPAGHGKPNHAGAQLRFWAPTTNVFPLLAGG